MIPLKYLHKNAQEATNLQKRGKDKPSYVHG